MVTSIAILFDLLKTHEKKTFVDVDMKTRFSYVNEMGRQTLRSLDIYCPDFHTMSENAKFNYIISSKCEILLSKVGEFLLKANSFKSTNQ